MKRLEDDELNLNEFMRSFKLETALKKILSYLGTNMDVNRAVIYIYNKNNNTLNSELVYVNGMVLTGDGEIYINPEDNSDEERIMALQKKKSILTPYYVYIPLMIENIIYGLLTVDKSLNEKKFSEDEIAFIKKIASVTATGIYQDKIISDRDNRIKQLNSLLNISMLLGSKDRESVLKYISHVLIKYGKFDRVRIYIRKEETFFCEVSDSILMNAFNNGENKSFLLDFFKNKMASDIYHFLSLEGQDLPLGFIEVDNILSQMKFDDEQISFLQIITSQLSMSLNNIFLLEKFKEISITDPLTHVYNYRYLLEYLNKEISRSQRFHYKFSVLLIDVDDFKRINDDFGHLKGDEALITLVNYLKSISRTIDVLSRYGGDEFIIVAPNTDREKAIEYAKRILQSMPEIQSQDKTKTKQIQISIGISTYPDDSQDITTLIKLADNKLYIAKKDGKNQVGT
jgi:diguanylate cyclase (GGDEF)-like protein